MKFKFIAKNNISTLPKTPGVYAFKKGAKRGARLRREGGGGVGVLYIGKAANLKERVKNHFLRPAFRDNLFVNQVEKIGFIKTNSEIEALILEANLIKKYQPKYNIIWRDDKNYFYIGITKENYPRVFITHRPKEILQKFKMQNSKFIGPFVDGTALKQTLKILRKVFPYRTCKTLPKRPCLWHQINRCPAPCLLSNLGKQIVRDRISNICSIQKECQRNTKNLLKFLKQGKNQVLKDLKEEMKMVSTSQVFERAAKIRDQIEALERVLSHAKIISEAVDVKHQQREDWQTVQKILKKILKTKKEISRIEAYDVSNIQGQEATGSLVTFINGLPDKNFYRRFKIKIAGKPNDIAMIKEVLSRRFRHPEWGLPDLILIDGGVAQLNAALKVKNQPRVLVIRPPTSGVGYPKVLALAKKENKLFVENQKKPILLKTLPREIFNLILQLRDEAHRFAISYHRKLRINALLN